MSDHNSWIGRVSRSMARDASEASIKRETSTIPDKDQLVLDRIKILEQDTTLERLVPGTTIGCKLLDEIAEAFEDAKTVSEIRQLTDSIVEIKGSLRSERVIIGVVGTTGAGKSSVINALLDEEFLVPTNCMRACTAVITEIQYNESTDPSTKYRAEVEFISKADFVTELEACLGDLQDVQKRDFKNPETDAGIAFSKIQAVFPHLAEKDLSKQTAKTLASHRSLSSLLGQSKVVTAPDPQGLLDEIQVYIDSSEKVDGQPREMEYWPLVKVVKIFLRNPILETGLVIVDLPGVQDSNAARSAVASKYIQNCSGLWIVAPITRAVDDKTAHNLMGTAFRRQMQLDGAYANMSFICSKIDDVSITEVWKLIKKGGDANHPAYLRYQELQSVEEEIRDLNDDIAAADSHHKDLLDQINECDLSSRRMMDAILSAERDGEITLLTPSPVKKRKGRPASQKPRKRAQTVVADSDTEIGSQDSDSDDESTSIGEPDLEEEVLSKEDARLRAEEMKEQKSLLEKQKKTSHNHKKALKVSLKEAKDKRRSLKSQVKSLCIQYRNEYSTGNIRHQFQEGVKEMDQDAAIRDNEDSFDPSHDARDYEALAENLPVFCVSSKAYQKMSGRLVKDDKLDGFPTIQDTGMAALQLHAMKIIESTHAHACRRFMTKLRRYLVSLMMQVVISQQPLKLADGMRNEELSFLSMAVEALKKKSEYSINETFYRCRRKVTSRIYDGFDGAIAIAFNEAPRIAASWSAPRDEGGMHFMTYRATCARQGVFKGSKGFRDLNEELVDPLKKQIAVSWESVCTRYIPEKLKDLGSELVEHLGAFIASMKTRQALRQSASYGLIIEKLETFEKSLHETAPLVNFAMEGQKEANRVFTPAISRAIDPAYVECGPEHGVGSYTRIKGHMSKQVELERSRMYATATVQAKAGLDAMLDALERSVENQVASIVAEAEEDISTLVADRNIFKTIGDVGKNIERLLATADARFSPAFDIPDSAPAMINNGDENMPERMRGMAIEDKRAESSAVAAANDDTLVHQAGMDNGPTRRASTRRRRISTVVLDDSSS